jgi:hypothetical protein
MHNSRFRSIAVGESVEREERERDDDRDAEQVQLEDTRMHLSANSGLKLCRWRFRISEKDNHSNRRLDSMVANDRRDELSCLLLLLLLLHSRAAAAACGWQRWQQQVHCRWFEPLH